MARGGGPMSGVCFAAEGVARGWKLGRLGASVSRGYQKGCASASVRVYVCEYVCICVFAVVCLSVCVSGSNVCLGLCLCIRI